MDFLDESVSELYNQIEIVESMEQLEEAMLEEPQVYGLQEATLFDF